MNRHLTPCRVGNVVASLNRPLQSRHHRNGLLGRVGKECADRCGLAVVAGVDAGWWVSCGCGSSERILRLKPPPIIRVDHILRGNLLLAKVPISQGIVVGHIKQIVDITIGHINDAPLAQLLSDGAVQALEEPRVGSESLLALVGDILLNKLPAPLCRHLVHPATV